MLRKFCKVLKNQKGFTLIELLAVVVILGIISAIAVPSIGGIIDNTKKDAHIANAKQMISAARLAVVSDSALQPKSADADVIISLEDLQDKGYLEPIDDPDGGSYLTGKTDSYVKVSKGTNDNSFVYKVRLFNSERGIAETSQKNLTRDSVIKK